MQRFKVLINPSFSGTTQPVTGSTIVFNNGLWVYPITNGGGVVNSSNVQSYLNDPRNQQITTDFIAYLTGNTTPVQFSNIFFNNQKLSDVFNSYYNNYVLSGLNTLDTTVINSSTSGSSSVLGYSFPHLWTGGTQAIPAILSGIPLNLSGSALNTLAYVFLQDNSLDENYYIPVLLTRTTDTLAIQTPVLCAPQITPTTAFLFPQYSAVNLIYFSASSPSTFYKTSSATTTLSSVFIGSLPFTHISALLGTGATMVASTADTAIHSLIQCFVDLNLQTDENSTYNFNGPGVSFQFPNYVVNEDTSFNVQVSLDSPSVLGIEQADIIFYNTGNSMTNLVLSEAFSSYPAFPVTLTWSAGQQTNILNFVGNSSFFESATTQSFELAIANIVNLNPGSTLNTNVDVLNTKPLRTASLGTINSAESIIGNVPTLVLNQGSGNTITVTLDAPAYGIEEVVVVATYTASNAFSSVTVGNNAALGVDYSMSVTTPFTFTFSPGQTQQSFNFSALLDLLQTQTEVVLQLSSPSNVLLDPVRSILLVNMKTSLPTANYIGINFGNTSVQYAGNVSSPTYFRNVATPFYSIGEYVNQPTDVLAWNSTAYDNLKKPHTFASNALIYYITNKGSYPIVYNSNIYVPGSGFLVTATTVPYSIVLPTNNNLDTTSNVLRTGTYAFSLQANYSDNLFKAKNEFNSLTGSAVNNTVNLGVFTLTGYSTTLTAINPSNVYNLYSRYSGVGTGRNPTYGLSCPTATSPFVLSTQESALIQGFIFVDFKSATKFLPFSSATNSYTNNAFKFQQYSFGVFTPNCPVYTNGGSPASEQWTTIPFMAV